MDNRNFLPSDKSQFPVSAETFDTLQSMIKLVSLLSGLGALNYILSGVVKTVSNYSDGYVVINGEILLFKGGAAVTTAGIDYCVIKQTQIDVQVYDQLFSNIGVTRWVESGIGDGQIALTGTNALTQIVSISALQNALSSLTTTVAGKANSNHQHIINDVQGLADALNAKMNANAGISGVTGLTDALNAKMNANATIPASQISGLQKGIVITDSVTLGQIDTSPQLHQITFPGGADLGTSNYAVVATLVSGYYGGEGVTTEHWKNDADLTFLIRTKSSTGFYVIVRNGGSPYSYVMIDYAIIMV